MDFVTEIHRGRVARARPPGTEAFKYGRYTRNTAAWRYGKILQIYPCSCVNTDERPTLWQAFVAAAMRTVL